jgi:RNA-directed DNA polymerase
MTHYKRCQTNITEGYKYVVDMDLEKYFDTVNQSKLIQILSETIKDGRVFHLSINSCEQELW